MFDDSGSGGKYLHKIKTILEIVAIPVAAYWAFTRFEQGEKPSLEPRVDMKGSLNWYARSKKDCLAEYQVTFRNIGKTSVDINRVGLRAWLMKEAPQRRAVALLDPKTMRVGNSFVDKEIKEDLVGHYAPDVGDTVGFVFHVERAPGQMIIFQLDAVSSKVNGREGGPWYDYRWDYACGEPPLEPVVTGKRRKH